MGECGTGRPEPAVVVTGGSRGIGYAVAQRLGRQGCRVAVVVRDEERGRSARTPVDVA
jgi:NAD(P)-dependent dehydrogenase (short-subunit alcohol dehydrogenase family)